MLNQQIIIYAHQYQAPAVVYAVQHDTGRTLTFVPGDFQIPAGATAQLWIKSPSGVLSFAAGSVSGQEITAALTEYNLAEAGNNLGQLQISADGDYIKGFSFILRVQEEVNGEELTPEEMTLLEQAIAEMQAEISAQLAIFEDELDTKAPKALQINGHALDQDITLTPEDIGAAAEDTEINGHPLTGDIDLTPEDVGAVPEDRLLNNYELDEDVTLHAVDIPFTPTPDIPETNVQNAINAAVGLMSEAHEDTIYTNAGTTSVVGDYTLTEDISGYQYLDILFNFQGEVELRRIPVDDGRSFKMRFSNLADSESSKFFGLAETNLSFSGTTMTIELNKYLAWPSGASEPELRTDGRPYVVTVYGIKYDAIGGPGGGVPIVIDDELSPNSTNPVQNKTIYKAITSGSSGLSRTAKLAILNCFANVAWIGPDGQTYYDALEAALFPPANLESITAEYTQSGIVYDSESLNDLRDDLVVTAVYDDETTAVITDYTLSGELEVGTSTITVSYGGFEDTFDVTVTATPTIYTITNTLTDVTTSNDATEAYEGDPYTATLSAQEGYVITATIVMGNDDITATAYNSSTGVITIAEVTGDISITATAAEDVGWISGVPYDVTFTQGKTISASDGSISDNSTYKATVDYIPCHGVTAIKCVGSGSPLFRRAYYDENKNFISYANAFYTDVGESHVIPPATAYYVRFDAGKNATITSITPYKYPDLTEETVWQSGQIYHMPMVSGTTTAKALCLGATTINMLVDAAIYGYRGYYSLFDAAKQRTNSMGSTNNFTRSAITVAATDYYFSLYSTTSGSAFLVKLS